MSEVLIRCENVSKKFCRDLKKSLWYGVKDSAADLMGWKRLAPSSEAREAGNEKLAARRSLLAAPDALRPGEFWANKDISFELKRGECLGLIGRNGAGKTTLLKMLSGLIKSDSGRIEIKGRVGALIALGAGFNPILTGRENVYVNGSILGLKKKQIDAKYDGIVEFAELQEFMESPVRSYSSGMQARLGFATASHFDCDLLLIDEVLAVGDFAFRQKCFRRLAMFVEAGGSVVLVSHALEQIMARTDRVILMDKGKVNFDGSPREAIHHYENQVVEDKFATAAENDWTRSGQQASSASPVRIVSAKFSAPERDSSQTIYPGDKVTLDITLDIDEFTPNVRLGISVFSQHEVILVQSITEQSNVSRGRFRLRCDFAAMPLRPSAYPVQIRVHDQFNACLDVIDRKDFLLRVEPPEDWDPESLRGRATSILDLESAWQLTVPAGSDTNLTTASHPQ